MAALDDLLDSALDGFDDDDDVDDAGDELQLDTASPAIDEDVPVTPPRPGTEPMDDLTSPLIGQMLANLQELESTTGVSKEEVGLLRNLIENLPSTATPSTSPSKKGKAPATTVTVPPPSPQPSSASATPKSEPKFKATAKAPAAAAAVVGPSMVDGPLEPWPSCAAPQPATELSFLGGMLRSKPPPPPPKAVGGAASLEANGMSFEDIMASASRQMSDNTEGVAAGLDGLGAGADIDGLDPEELAKMQDMMSKLAAGLDGEEGGDEGLGIMEQMMEHLLAKDVYIKEKYPEYLEEHGATLSKEDLQKYTEQEEVIKEICATYEDDALDTKKQVGKVMELMEKMQAYGAPPQEIIKALDVEVGPDGMPSLGGLLGGGGIPGMPGGEKCSIM
eukprot:gene15130-6090_t